MIDILDTFNDFLDYWRVAKSKTISQQIELWCNSYMSRYPGLLEKQIQNYKSQGLDWKEVAKKMVFPKLTEYLPLMCKARENLLKLLNPIYEQAFKVLGLDFNITFIIYVGLGCGAGWATQYEKSPACLFGLENIAESKWYSKERLKGLIAHEIGHLVHMAWRNEWDSFNMYEQDALFQLYSEGFAQRCEHLILGRETWHEMQDENWLSWCLEHKVYLAKEYISRVKACIPVNDFFGSWLDIKGKKQTGYFLGHDFIRWLEKKHDIRKISTLPLEEVKEKVIQYLHSIKTIINSRINNH